MKPDPPAKKDGTCACGCGRRVNWEMWQRYARGHRDVFATTDCARKWHDTKDQRIAL